MTDILEKLVTIKTMDEGDVKAKFGTSSSNVQKVLKSLLLEEMVEDQQKEPKSKYKKKTPEPSGGSSEFKKVNEPVKNIDSKN